MEKVITYQTPGGNEINLTRSQIRTLYRARIWPKNSRGEEYCRCVHGLHHGAATYTDDEIGAMVKGGHDGKGD